MEKNNKKKKIEIERKIKIEIKKIEKNTGRNRLVIIKLNINQRTIPV